MRGLTRQERAALIVDPTAPLEWIPNLVFDDLIGRGLARWVGDGDAEDVFDTTPLGQLALRVCP